MPIQFVTVPDELLPYASPVVEYFEGFGYALKPEHYEVGFPQAPTLRCKRGRTTIIVELLQEVDTKLAAEWIGYCRSTNKDVRFSFAVPGSGRPTAEAESELRGLGAGVLIVMDDGHVMEAITPRDIAVNLALPDRTRLPPRLRKKLGAVYEQYERSQWREAFGDAAQVLEVEARLYLRKNVERGRVTFVDGTGNPKQYTLGRIDKMTLGALATAFSEIQVQNHIDLVVGRVLQAINKDRVGEVHKKHELRTEQRLRRNVGAHIWKIVDALKHLEKAT